jgi:hypothetical protein
MTEYTKADYLAACDALWDGKQTEYLGNVSKNWISYDASNPPFSDWAKSFQWRPVDPLREYREAFAQGKRVEYKSKVDGNWYELTSPSEISRTEFEYRIVEEPKTVKLFPFAYKECEEWRHSGYHATIQDAASWHESGTPIVPINADGSIEVES